MFSSKMLCEGDIYTRNDLSELFKTKDSTINTGIFPLTQYHAIWLFITEEKSKDKTQYTDLLKEDTLLWDGQMMGVKDHKIISHEANNTEILVFYRKKKNEFENYGFKYEGRFCYVSHTGSRPAHFVLKRVASVPATSPEEVKNTYEEKPNISKIDNAANSERQIKETNTSLKSLKIMSCYARKDEKWQKQLDIHLFPLKRKYHFEDWFDGKIDPGSDWANEITSHLNAAHIILLLISSNFIASHFCYDIEMQRAIERHERGEACVIPIILSPTHWQDTPLGKLQAIPRNGQALRGKHWKNSDDAFHEVVSEIKKVIEQQHTKLD